MAPEIRKVGHLHKKSDVYNFGVLLYSMLNGCFKHTPSKYADTSANDLISNCLEINVPNRFTAKEALQHPWLQ
jgi:serine/threonine protein kinase